MIFCLKVGLQRSLRATCVLNRVKLARESSAMEARNLCFSASMVFPGTRNIRQPPYYRGVALCGHQAKFTFMMFAMGMGCIGACLRARFSARQAGLDEALAPEPQRSTDMLVKCRLTASVPTTGLKFEVFNTLVFVYINTVFSEVIAGHHVHPASRVLFVRLGSALEEQKWGPHWDSDRSSGCLEPLTFHVQASEGGTFACIPASTLADAAKSSNQSPLGWIWAVQEQDCISRSFPSKSPMFRSWDKDLRFGRTLFYVALVLDVLDPMNCVL